MPTARKKSNPRNIKPSGFSVLMFPNKDGGSHRLGYLDNDKAVAALEGLHKSADMAINTAEQVGHDDFAKALRRDKVLTRIALVPFVKGEPTAPPCRPIKPKRIYVARNRAEPGAECYADVTPLVIEYSDDEIAAAEDGSAEPLPRVEMWERQADGTYTVTP